MGSRTGYASLKQSVDGQVIVISSDGKKHTLDSVTLETKPKDFLDPLNLSQGKMQGLRFFS